MDCKWSGKGPTLWKPDWGIWEVGIGRWTTYWKVDYHFVIREAACCRGRPRSPLPTHSKPLISALAPRGPNFVYCFSPIPRGQRKSLLVCLQTLPALSRCRADLQTVIALASLGDLHAGLSLEAPRATSPRQTAGQSPRAPISQRISQSAAPWLAAGKFKLNATKEP